ncbi:MAG TPA: hypothetical protein VFE51_00080 [Verrucomicrobiae bacterium]|nr:hypothetical protein [Verrucomicrobiae bacterium]
MNSLKFAAVFVGLAGLALASNLGLRAQQNKNTPLGVLNTNWIGCLVFGSEDTSDPIARGPHPTTDRRVEVGLRSDGVVIWRPTPRSP